MPEIWTYRLSDFLLFSPRTYYRLFERANEALWPWHVVAIAAGLILLLLVTQPRANSGRASAAILALAWAASGWFFVLERYATINWAATYMAAAFALQCAILVLSGVAGGRLARPATREPIGVALTVFAVAAYPALAMLWGRPWDQAEVFGLMPDPVAIATLGALLCARRMPWEAAIVPLLWCLMSTLTLWAMDSLEALIPFGAAVIAIAATLWRKTARNYG